MRAKSSVLSGCIVGLLLAVPLAPAESHAAILVEPHTNWTLTINNKDIFPAADAPGPPDGPLLRAEAKRAFGGDPDAGAAGQASISAPNFTADPLMIKAAAKVTNTSTAADGVSATTSLNFSRIYKTKNPLSSGSVNLVVKGKIKGIEGTLITQNPFFFPIALVDLQIDITEVDSSGVPLEPGPFAPFVKINPLQGPPSRLGPFAWAGDAANPGRKTTTVKTNFKGSLRFKKKVNETKYFKIEGLLGVAASIQKVESLADRQTYLAEFFELVELNDPANQLTPAELLAAAALYIDLGTGTLTPAGMSGFAIADFFGTVDLTVDTEILVPGLGPPGLALLAIVLLAGAGLMHRRYRQALG
jgi:hypothetical protein